MDEEALIREILSRLETTTGPDIVVGPGDDAAIVRLTEGADLVATTDSLVEGVHFDSEWARPEDVGFKLFEVNASDLAAMGARPRWVLVSAQVPQGGASRVSAVVEAAAERARDRSANVVGGNISSGASLSFTAVALGEITGTPLRRSRAHAGDLVFASGPFGLASIGLAALRAGRGAEAAFFDASERFRRPVARVAEGEAARGFGSAAIDVSDGLVLDLGRLCSASYVGARIRLRDAPQADRIAALASVLGRDPDETIASGGEDYELLVTVPPSSENAALEAGFVRVGEIVEGSRVEVERMGGGLYEGPKGYGHTV